MRIEGPQAIGSMSVIFRWECPETEAIDPVARVSRRASTISREEKGERESATLAAVRRGFSSYFIAGIAHRHSGGKKHAPAGPFRRTCELCGPPPTAEGCGEARSG